MNDPRSHSRARRIHREVVGPPGRRNPCFYCGRPASHADDLVPVSKGGNTKDRRNLVAACAHCNQSKGNRAAPTRGVAERGRSVFSGGRNSTPHILSPHTHRDGRTTLAADYSRKSVDAGR